VGLEYNGSADRTSPSPWFLKQTRYYGYKFAQVQMQGLEKALRFARRIHHENPKTLYYRMKTDKVAIARVQNALKWMGIH
jgi:hypothetical protein